MVATALSTSTFASPARISIYTNKISALASPAKGGVSISRNVENAPQRSLKNPLEQVTKDRKSTFCAKNKVFGCSLDEQELLQETEEESCRLLMAPLGRFINEETQADTAQKNDHASCMKILQEQFESTACQNCNLPGNINTDRGLETTPTHSIDSPNYDGVDNNVSYNGKNDDDDKDFTYHSSDGSDKDDEDGDEVLGNDTDGSHQHCLHVAKMVRVSLGDSWPTCQIGCMTLKQITH